MNATDFFTRRILGMDYRVWEAMLLISFISVGLYGYKKVGFNTINNQPCPIDSIAVNGKKVVDIANGYVSRYYQFAIQSEVAETVEWDFGDDTNVEGGPIVSHKFIQEGIYKITATINGSCEYEAVVEIVYNPFLSGNQEKPVVEIFADPMHPTVGSNVKFYCVSDLPSITSYEWKVSNTKEVQKDAVPAFTFRNAETYEIQLVINNDRSKIWTTVIKVTEGTAEMQEALDSKGSGVGMPGEGGPLGRLVTEEVNPINKLKDLPANKQADIKSGVDSSNEPSIAKVPKMDPEAFRDLLQSVVDQNGKELEDLYEYLDYGASTKVAVNEDKPLISLKDFCKDMREKKKNRRKIESVDFKIDDKKSIQSIQVKVPETRGFWDRINPFN